MLNNVSHADFLSLFAVSIAFNFAYIIKDTEQNRGEVNEKKGFFCFIRVWHKSFIRKFEKRINRQISHLRETDWMMEFLLADKKEKEDNYYFKLNQKIHETLDKILLLKQEIQRCTQRIPEHNHMFSICLLLGLYGIFILFVAPLLAKNNDIIENVFFFNTNIVCIFFLIMCIIWDDLHRVKKGRGLRLKYFRLLRPKRRTALAVFIGLFFYFISYIMSRFYIMEISADIFDRTVYVTIFICYSAFVIYIIRAFLYGWCKRIIYKLRYLCLIYNPALKRYLKIFNDDENIKKLRQQRLSTDAFNLDVE